MIREDIHTNKGDLELGDLINAFLKKWYWFLLFAVLGFAVAKWYTSRLSRIHEVQSVVLIDDTSERTVVRENPVPGLSLTNRVKRIENEIAILSSKDIMEQAVERTQAFITCFIGHQASEEVFLNELPITFLSSRIPRSNAKTEPILFTDNGDGTFQLQLQGERHPNVIVASYGDELFIGSNRLVISKKEHDAYWSSDQGTLRLTFYLNPFDNMVASFRRKLEVFETARNSDGIMLRMEESIPERGVALQQAIIQNYLLGMDEQRKDMAENAFDFIEGRLKLNHGDLDSLEIIMEDYRRSKDMVAPDKKIDYLYQGIKEFKTELSDAQTQLDIVEQLITSIEQNKNEVSVPNTALGVRDPLLNNLLATLAEKENEREEMKETVHQNNPLFKQLNNQIAELKTSMFNDLISFGKNLRISVRDIESRIAEYEYEILQLSGNNRELDGLARKRDNMEELYNYLLKRREEAALVAAAELIDTWIIEKPHVESSFYKPRKSMILIIGILLALLVPATFVGYRYLFDRRIGSTNDLKGIKDLPVLSSVGNETRRAFGLSNDKSRLNTREDFKALYFNLQFVAPDAKKILFTSIGENEGKTHCAINYGMTLAALGKRTCVVELDLRKPSFIDRLEISGTQGVLNMLDGSASLDDVLRRSTLSDDLRFISAGTSDQDPLKLLMSNNFTNLLNELAKRFDHIIIDSPPTLVSADIMVLSAHADLNIFVVREGLTPQSELKEIADMHMSQRIGNMALLLNGDSSRKASSGYLGKTG